ncbi:MAG: hypothetical protein GX878_09680 [Firmicutes bacterium]|nr:hypothetical protein [Bacillota bacterium]
MTVKMLLEIMNYTFSMIIVRVDDGPVNKYWHKYPVSFTGSERDCGKK